MAAFAVPARSVDASGARGPDGCGDASKVTPSAPRWFTQRRMTLLVDSVLLGGVPALRREMPCWRVSKQGRPALMLAAAERELRTKDRRVHRLVVVGLGYNSLWERERRRHRRWAARFDRETRRLLKTLRRRGARQIVWVTLREPTRRTVPRHARADLGRYSWYFPYVNERLRLLDDRRDDVVLADWAVAGNRRGVTYDSIHLNSRGSKVMAKVIEREVLAEAERQSR